jgi:hypothetical protein
MLGEDAGIDNTSIPDSRLCKWTALPKLRLYVDKVKQKDLNSLGYTNLRSLWDECIK